MADFIDSNGINHNDFNDTFTFSVCVMQALNINNLGKADDWNSAPETLKIFEPEQQNEAEKYAMALNLELSAFPKGSYVLISSHKSMFNFV